MKHSGFIFLLALSILSFGQELRAQAYRNTVGVPPVEVYQSMLNFVDRKEYAKVAGSLNVLSPILNHIAAKFKADPAKAIKTAVGKGNPDEILLSVQVLIALDIRDLLDEALRQAPETPDVSKTAVKAARLNYELLSPYVQQKDFASDQKIKKNFTDSFRVLGAEAVYSAEKIRVNTDQLKRHLEEVVSGLLTVFPSR